MLDAPTSRRRRPGPTADEVLATLRRHWYVLLLPVLLLGALFYLVANAQQRVYAVTGQVFFDLRGAQGPSDASRSASTQAALAGSGLVVDRAASELRLPPDAVRGQVVVEPSAEANVLTFRAKSPSASQAGAMVQAMERAYDATLTDTQRQSATDAAAAVAELRATLQRQLDGVVAQIRAGNAGTTLAASQAALTQQLQALDARQAEAAVSATLDAGGVRVNGSMGPAVVVSPLPVRSAAIAAIFGLLLGVAAVWLLARRAARLRAYPAAARELGLPVLARLGGTEGRSRAGVERDQSALEAGLDLAGSAGVQVLALVPDGPALDSVVTLRVAAALAALGRAVTLVDVDPGDHGITTLPRPPGAGTPSGSATMGGVVQTYWLPEQEAELTLLSVVPGNGASAFRWSSLPAWIAELRDGIDLLMLVCPAGLDSPATTAALASSDATVLVTSESRADELAGTVTALRASTAILLGLLVRRGSGRSPFWAAPAGLPRVVPQERLAAPQDQRAERPAGFRPDLAEELLQGHEADAASRPLGAHGSSRVGPSWIDLSPP